MNGAKIRKRIRQIRNILFVVLIILVIGAPIFFYFNVDSKARSALREAKNVKMALEMVDIEYYSQSSSIYDGTKADGLREGVVEKVYKLLEQDGEIVLQSYSQKKREIKALTYTNSHYEVYYYYDEQEGDQWRVRYFITII
jgi:hypothetical protein